jgi:hypothetical protein
LPLQHSKNATANLGHRSSVMRLASLCGRGNKRGEGKAAAIPFSFSRLRNSSKVQWFSESRVTLFSYAW